MEILRFDGAGGSSAQGKKSSKGLLAIGLVATLFGIGSAFASSTITINSNAPIALGQGVTAVTACDENISIAPTTNMRVGDSGPKFYIDTITVSNVDTSTTVAGIGCKDKAFDLQIFNADTVTATAYSCSVMGNFPQSVLGTKTGATCTTESKKISFTIDGSRSTFAIQFSNFDAAIGYITLVSREVTP